jgi:beta-lactamase superfamily II metal-dependent hydrolase
MMMDLPELIIVDVGHGNCAILRDTDGVIVIDCALGNTLVETLEHLSIREISHVVISHADEDHIAGIITLLLDKNIKVYNIFLNSDSSKRTKTWKGLRIALKDARERSNIKISVGLTTEMTGDLNVGQVNVEILAPTPEFAVSGVGGEDLQGRRLNSNSMSAVIGITHGTHRIAVLPGDIDAVALNNLLEECSDIAADILVFPHHGGNPGNMDSQEFAQLLCGAVRPRLTIFSIGRGRFGNPRKKIIQGVQAVVPDVHILCTQLSTNCAATPLDSGSSHLTNLPARGRDNNNCCGGTILIKINGEKTTYVPTATSHKDFISSKVPTPLCIYGSSQQ